VPEKKMVSFLRLRPNVTVTYSGLDLAVAALAAAVVAGWAAVAGGTFSPLALGACEVAFLAFYLVGSLFAAWGALAAGALFDLPLRLLMGYATINTALLVLAWLSPLGIVANFGLLFAGAAALFVVARPIRQRQKDDSVGLLVVGLSLVAATLWCQDSLRPIAVEENTVTFKPWIDGFYHAVHLRIFGAAHGASTIEDFRMAGVPARLYHYGAYMVPAFIRQASAIHSYAAFAGILAPMGVFFTGLGAYALVGSFWGSWPGLAAASALLLLPDGAQQGMQNSFMSYHWLTQISPSASYGLALLALAWMFVLLGCRRGSWVQLMAGWLIAGILTFYKLHFFIASALLLSLLPPLFFRRPLGVRRRILWAVSAAAVYVVTVVGVQKVPGVPLIRLDGSSIREIFSLIKGFAQRGGLRDLLDSRLGPEHSRLSNVTFGAPYVLLSTLGLFAPLLIILAISLRKRTSPVLVIFPLLLVANFLVMFLGLALDLRSSTPDELSHRPIMIVYFFVVAWVGGAAGLSLLESPRLGRLARPVLLCAAVSLLAIPAFLGAGVQRIAAMRMFSPVRVPLGLVRAAEYIRDHGDGQDLVQDSQFDRTYALAALAERRAYASRSLTIISYNIDLLQQRIALVERFMDLREVAAVVATAQQIGLRWFLLDPGDQVAWPAEIVQHPVFELGGYRLYRF
jgi:hypothetical protein